MAYSKYENSDCGLLTLVLMGGGLILSSYFKNCFHSHNYTFSRVSKGMVQGTPSPWTPLQVRKIGYILQKFSKKEKFTFSFVFRSKKCGQNHSRPHQKSTILTIIYYTIMKYFSPKNITSRTLLNSINSVFSTQKNTFAIALILDGNLENIARA